MEVSPNKQPTETATESYGSVNDVSNYGTHWHVRVHDPTPEFLGMFVQTCRALQAETYLSYAVIGEEKTRSDKGVSHIHAALGTYKSLSKFHLAQKLKIRGNNKMYRQWYVSPIYASSSPAQNAEYCRKGNVLLDVGKIPEIAVKNLGAEELRGKCAEKWKEMIALAKLQRWEDIELKYPYEYIANGSKLRALYFIQHTPEGRSHQQHLWIYGAPGTGKSCVVEYMFPGHFKKRPDSDWLGYNPVIAPGHNVVYLPDFDIQSMKMLKAETLKVMCDPQGFNANKKFAGGEIIAPGRVVVTSNFRIGDCFPPGYPGVETQKAALRRRFKEIHIDDYLKELHLELKTKEELQKLKDDGNFDWSKCFKDTSFMNDAVDIAEEEFYNLLKRQKVQDL